MANVTWDKIFRQVALKGGLLIVDSAATLETNYGNPLIDSAELLTKGLVFPKPAVDDAILSAGDRIVRAIGENPTCSYRKDFTDITNSLANGAFLPQISASGAPIVGVVGAVRDAATGHELEPTDLGRQEIDEINSCNLKSSVYEYYTDSVRIWHTRVLNRVICDVVVWEKEAVRYWMNALIQRGDVDFTEDLHETLVNGALGELFRGTYNSDIAPIYNGKFENSLKEIRMYGRVTSDQT